MVDAKNTAIGLTLSALRLSGAAAAARPFLSGSCAILMLHRVTEKNWSPLGLSSGLTISPRFLDRLLADIRKRGQAIVPMDEVPEILRAGRSRQVVAITSDDAYLDNFTEALPVLEAHSAPFTIYVAPGLVSGETLPWWEVAEELVMQREALRLPQGDREIVLPCRSAAEKRAAARRLADLLTTEVPETQQQAALRALGAVPGPARRFMNWDELRALVAHPLATLGAHTVHHANLRRLDEQDVLREMRESAAIIESETGARPRHFAYPYGHRTAVGPREVDLARQAGFATAVTTRHGVLQPGHAAHLHALPRISVNGNFQTLGHMRTLMSGLTAFMAGCGRRVVTT